MYLKYMYKSYNNKNYNCWDFIRDFYLNELNIILPDFNLKGVGQYKEKYKIFKEQEKNWIKIKDIKTLPMYCLVVLKSHKPADHVGIYIGNNKFLHNTKQSNVAISSLNSFEWKNNIIGFYKHEKL